MGYTLIIGSKANAQAQADFEAAVEGVGGAAVCIGGVAVDGNTVVQAVNQGGNSAARVRKVKRTKRNDRRRN